MDDDGQERSWDADPPRTARYTDTPRMSRIEPCSLWSSQLSSRRMSRHSKWSKVKQFKGAIDAKRSASFTKLAREITVCAREKGGDPAMNAGLRAAIGRAREASVPRENIERAIARGTGEGDAGVIEQLTYEAYALGGTALIIEALTDNRNRTANDVKHLLTKGGGTLATSGAVTYLFDRFGIVRIPQGIPRDKRDEAELLFIEAGAEQMLDDGEAMEIQCHPHALATVAEAVTRAGYETDTVEFQWIPKTLVETDEANGRAVAELIETLEAHDDVSRVFSNLA